MKTSRIDEAEGERMTSVHVNGVELEYVDEGTATPVLFSHGTFAS
jgi:hypothetical protein